MIAAVYARKPTEQNGDTDEEKSVTRQVEHARAYAHVGPGGLYYRGKGRRIGWLAFILAASRSLLFALAPRHV